MFCNKTQFEHFSPLRNWDIFCRCPRKYYEKRLLALSRLSNQLEQLGSDWADFLEISHLKFFGKSVEKIQIH